MFLLDLDDRAAAWHLANALDLWARKCLDASPRVPFPPGLEELRRRAWSRAKSDRERQEPTSVADLDGVVDAQPVVLWLTVDEVASALAVSPRQVERWIAEGQLPSFKVGGLRRIHRVDAAEFADRRGAGVNVSHRSEGSEGSASSPDDLPAPVPAGTAR